MNVGEHFAWELPRLYNTRCLVDLTASTAYGVRTGVSWTPWKYLTLTPNAFFSTIDVETGTPGDADWYLYDANEFG